MVPSHQPLVTKFSLVLNVDQSSVRKNDCMLRPNAKHVLNTRCIHGAYAVHTRCALEQRALKT